MKRNNKGRSAGGVVSGDIPFWPYGEPGPELLTCQRPYAPVPDPDSTAAYLALAVEEINHAIEYLKSACRDARVDESLGEFTLDALRGIRDEIEAESR